MSDSNPNARRANTPAPAEVDVAIVGAGLGGLVAGATLARAGRSVAVFDAHYVAGGCATHFTRGPRSKRYHFDVGVHYVGDCGAEGQIPRMLRGLDATVDFERLDPDGFDTLVFPDLTFRIPADVSSLITEFVVPDASPSDMLARGFIRSSTSSDDELPPL